MQIESNLYLGGTPETLLTEIIVKYKDFFNTWVKIIYS